MAKRRKNLSVTQQLEKILRRYIRRFFSLFPTEEDSVEELFRIIYPEGPECQLCGSTRVRKNFGDRLVHCDDCKKDFWFTAGTFFDRIRNAQAWVGLIWLLERGVMLNAGQCNRSFGIATSTASEMLKKLSTVIHGQMDDHSVSSGEFITLLTRRSSETPARQHPRAEEIEVEKSLREQLKSETDNVNEIESTLSEEEKIVYESLSDKSVHFDQIQNATGLDAGVISGALTMLELADLSERKAGDNYIAKHITIQRSNRAIVPGIARAIDAASNLVRIVFHGLSRKNLQLYLAATWCFMDRTRWQAGRLFEACLQHRAITGREIRSYVTPPTVRLFLVP